MRICRGPLRRFPGLSGISRLSQALPGSLLWMLQLQHFDTNPLFAQIKSTAPLPKRYDTPGTKLRNRM